MIFLLIDLIKVKHRITSSNIDNVVDLNQVICLKIIKASFIILQFNRIKTLS